MRISPLILLTLLSIAHCATADRANLPELTIPGAQGVNIHFTDPKPGEMKMLADAGFKWVRMDFAWGGIEREKGKYDFSACDRLLENLKPHDIRAIFILDYANSLYDNGLSPHTDESRAAMAAFATAAVTHFKGRGIVWEMWNEPNIKQFWKPTPSADDYAKLALAIGKAIRAAAPDELYVGPATSTIDLKFLETCFKAGCLNYWDAVSVHPYRQKDPETASEECRKLRLLIAEYAPKDKKIPILSGEWGYSSAWKNFDEEKQAQFLPREFLVNLYNEIPISIWYDWHDDGVDPKEGEHHFGTVHNAYTKDAENAYDPKRAYVAMKMLSQTLSGFQYNKRLVMDKQEDWVLLFNKGDDLRLAVWTTSNTPHDIFIPAAKGSTFDIVSADGSRKGKWTVPTTAIVVRAADSVQFLIPHGADSVLNAAADWERSPLEVVITAPKLELVVNEIGYIERGDEMENRPFSLKVEGNDPFKQQTTIIIANPLRFIPLAITGDSLWFEVQNPTGEAFEGEIMVRRYIGLKHSGFHFTPVILKSGEKSKLIDSSLKKSDSAYSIEFLVCRERMHDVITQIVKKSTDASFLAIEEAMGKDDAELKKGFELHADGDSKVHSTQTVTFEKPPSPVPTGGSAAIKLSYTFDAGWKFLELQPSAAPARKIAGEPKALALWLYGDNSNHALRLRFIDSIGQTFQATGPSIDFKGWKYLTIPMTGEDLTHWGKGDGQIHYPIHWDSLLLLDNTSREKSSGEIWVTGMTLVE